MNLELTVNGEPHDVSVPGSRRSARREAAADRRRHRRRDERQSLPLRHLPPHPRRGAPRRGRDLAAMLEHVSHDKLVAWGWDPGVGRARSPFRTTSSSPASRPRSRGARPAPAR